MSTKIEEQRIQILLVRAAVAMLGEKSQRNWWSSDFYAPASDAFLNPLFPKTKALARCSGANEAARRVHDEAIGVSNRVFHLFRLPSALEQQLHGLLREDVVASKVASTVSSAATAMEQLQSMAGSLADSSQGPVALGDFNGWHKDRWLNLAAAHYVNALNRDVQCFPYATVTD
jgi:hypothetical protein